MRITHSKAYGDQPPIVTPSLAKMIVEFNFAPEDQDDLSRGLQPFVISNGNVDQRNASLINAMKFGRIGLLQLQDLKALLAREVKHIPITYMELNNT